MLGFMLSAVDASGLSHFAPTTAKSIGPFFCPECKAPLILKKGTVVVHHFAHKPPVECAYGTGESLEHMRAKLAIYGGLMSSSRVTKLDVEKPIEKDGLKARPDVRCVIDNKYAVGIEFQRSPLDPREIERRTSVYHTLNVHVLWVIPWPKKLVGGGRYQPRETERYLHTLYYGRVFFWQDGIGLIPVQFESYIIERESREWYIEGGRGEMDSSEGYAYRSRKWVTPVVGRSMSILDLGPVLRKEYRSGPRSLPAARLWTVPFDARSRARRVK